LSSVRVVLDYQVFSWQQHGGISRYFCEIAERLADYDDCDVTVLAPLYVNAYLPSCRQRSWPGGTFRSSAARPCSGL
jgi:hypothetical protein